MVDKVKGEKKEDVSILTHPLSIVLCFSMIGCVRLKGGKHTPKAIFGMCKTSGKLLFKHLSVYAITRQHFFGGVVMLHLLHICYKVGIGN